MSEVTACVGRSTAPHVVLAGLTLAGCVDLMPPWSREQPDAVEGPDQPGLSGVGGRTWSGQSGGSLPPPYMGGGGAIAGPGSGGTGGDSAPKRDGSLSTADSGLISAAEVRPGESDTHAPIGSGGIVATDAPLGSGGLLDSGGAGGGAGNSGRVDAANDASGVAGDACEAPPGVPDVSPDVVLCAGGALSLDGASYASIKLPVYDDFTLEAWIKTTASLSGTKPWDGRGLLYADVKMNNNDFGTSILNNRLAFGVGNPPDTDIVLMSTSQVASGLWVHVAVTRTRGTGAMQVLVNGIVEASLASSTQTASLKAAANLTIGANTVDNKFFIGLIDELRVWNIARTAAEISSTMHQRLAGDEAGLVGYWHFDGTPLDSSPSQATMSLAGQPTWSPFDVFCDP